MGLQLRHDLDRTKRGEILAMVEELARRGLEVPDIKTTVKFPVDSANYFVRIDGKQYNPNDKQYGFIDSTAAFSAFISGRGGGKALHIDTPILTIDGWKSMEDIQVGDIVFDELGNPTKVISISNIVYGRKCYNVIFSDGSIITADGDHLWLTWNHSARKAYRRAKNPRSHPSIVTTKEILETLTCCDRGDVNHSIRVCGALKFPEKDLPVHPYVFGFWLGDGNSRCSRLTIGEEESVKIIESFGYKLKKEKTKYSYNFVPNGSIRDKITGRYTINPESVYCKLKELNVLKNKHIPKTYLYASFEQRLLLLQGLLDSDGSSQRNGKITFCSMSKILANQVLQLVLSFGIKATINENDAKLYGKYCGIRYRISFRTTLPVFRLQRKLRRIRSKYRNEIYHRYIKNIVETSRVPVKCITVDSPSHLYLAGKALIPTHNSAAGAQKALRKLAQGESGAVLNPDFENFKISTWPEFREWIPWDLVVPSQRYRGEDSWEPYQPFTLTFINGAQVLCKGLKDPDSARGPNINWLWYDEAGRDPDGLAWQIALASVRVGEDIQAWVTTTPKGKSHWLYKFFVKQDIPEDAIEAFTEVAKDDQQFIEYFHTSIWENKQNLNPLFFANMLASYPKGFLRKRELEGQFSDEGGTMGDSAWFHGKILPSPPETVSDRIRYWDLAASEKKLTGKKRSDPDATVGTKMSWIKDGTKDENNVIQIGKFYIEDQVSGHWLYDDILEAITNTAIRDGSYIKIYIEEEPGAGGKNQVAAIAKHIKETLGSRYKVEGHNPKQHGDKIMRANVWFAEAANGQFFLIHGDWNKPFLDCLDEFPDARHDDEVDSASGARHVLAPVKLWKSVKFLFIGMKKKKDKKQ